nr:Unknown Function [uncultured bacterium]
MNPVHATCALWQVDPRDHTHAALAVHLRRCRRPEPDRHVLGAGARLASSHDDGDEVVLEPPEGSPEAGISPDILFLRVPEGKTVKNRLHLDLRPEDQPAEVARLIGMGATHADVGQPADASFTVLRDPEGNELCVLRALPT